MKSAKRSPDINESSKMCRSVLREVATSVECKTKTDVKENFDEVSCSCDPVDCYSDRFHHDSCLIQMTDFKVYRLWNMTAILYLPT